MQVNTYRIMGQVKVKSFKSTDMTHRFNLNQRVWIVGDHANHLRITYQYRNKGRWVEGVISRESKSIGEIDEFRVSEDWARKRNLQTFQPTGILSFIKRLHKIGHEV